MTGVQTCALPIFWAVFDRLASRSETRGSVIAEAFIGYLIVANAFSQVYWIFYKLIPNSFASVAGSAQSSTFLYFSLSTLSALGAGDILPLNPFVRLLSALESITGIFFIAVVVARLVSAYRTAVEVDVAGRNAAP